MSAIQKAQVLWYRKHGKHPEKRIVREYSGTGSEYVIGDFSWHRNPANPIERIDRRMKDGMGDKDCRFCGGFGLVKYTASGDSREDVCGCLEDAK